MNYFCFELSTHMPLAVVNRSRQTPFMVLDLGSAP